MTKRFLCRFGISQEELGEEKLNDVEYGNGWEQALFCIVTKLKATATFRFTRTAKENIES